jgi:hypothetical protein
LTAASLWWRRGRRKAPSCTKSKASRQRAHHRGGKTRRRTPNAFEASCRQAAGPRIRGFGWQMRKMRRRPNQLQASPCIIGDELLQIGSGVARRTKKDDSKSSAPLLRVVTSFVLFAFSTSSKCRRRETRALAACWDVGCTVLSRPRVLRQTPLFSRLDSVGPDRRPCPNSSLSERRRLYARHPTSLQAPSQHPARPL